MYVFQRFFVLHKLLFFDCNNWHFVNKDSSSPWKYGIVLQKCVCELTNLLANYLEQFLDEWVVR